MRAATVNRGGIFMKLGISIHAAHEGCDETILRAMGDTAIFQSTQPMRAATGEWGLYHSPFLISIHAAHEGCDGTAICYAWFIWISIHAAHEGCDRALGLYWNGTKQFQSTQPMRAATAYPAGK